MRLWSFRIVAKFQSFVPVLLNCCIYITHCFMYVLCILLLPTVIRPAGAQLTNHPAPLIPSLSLAGRVYLLLPCGETWEGVACAHIQVPRQKEVYSFHQCIWQDGESSGAHQVINESSYCSIGHLLCIQSCLSHHQFVCHCSSCHLSLNMSSCCMLL